MYFCQKRKVANYEICPYMYSTLKRFFFFSLLGDLTSANGLSLGSDVANSFVDNNVGVTAGYTVFALTIQWGACVVFRITGPSLENEERKTITVNFSLNLESISCMIIFL